MKLINFKIINNYLMFYKLKKIILITLCSIFILITIFFSFLHYNPSYVFYNASIIDNNFMRFFFKTTRIKNIITQAEFKKDNFLYNLIYKKKIINSNLPVYNFILSEDAVMELKVFEYYKDIYKEVSKKKYDAKLRCKEGEFEMEIKYHFGRLPALHIDIMKKSFNINIVGDKLLDQRRDWTFINPFDRFGLGSHFLYELNKKLGLLDYKSKFVQLNVNDRFFAIYFVESDMDKDPNFLYYNNLKNHVVIKTEPTEYSRFGVNNEHMTIHPIKIPTVGDSVKNEIYRNYFSFLKSLENDNINKYIDYKNTAGYLALLYIKGYAGEHDMVVGNLRWIYNLISGRFFIAPRHELGILPIGERSTYPAKFLEKNLAENLYEYGKNGYFIHLIKNDSLRDFKDQYLSKMLNDLDIITEYKNLKDSIADIISIDVTNEVRLSNQKNMIDDEYEYLQQNVYLIKEIYSYAKMFVTCIANKNILQINLAPDSHGRLVFENFEIDIDSLPIQDKIKIEVYDKKDKLLLTHDTSVVLNTFNLSKYFNRNYLFVSLNDEMYPERVEFTYQITFLKRKTINLSKKNLKIKVKNNFTNLTLDRSSIDIAIIKQE